MLVLEGVPRQVQLIFCHFSLIPISCFCAFQCTFRNQWLFRNLPAFTTMLKTAEMLNFVNWAAPGVSASSWYRWPFLDNPTLWLQASLEARFGGQETLWKSLLWLVEEFGSIPPHGRTPKPRPRNTCGRFCFQFNREITKTNRNDSSKTCCRMIMNFIHSKCLERV